jgi:hypothetical protein
MDDGSSDFDPASMGADQKDEQAPAAGAADTKVIARILRADPTLSLPEAREMARRVALIDPRNFESQVPQRDGPVTEFLKSAPERAMNSSPSGGGMPGGGGGMPGMPGAGGGGPKGPAGVGGGAAGAGEAAAAGEGAAAAEGIGATLMKVLPFLV